jgi:hypothetical protein
MGYTNTFYDEPDDYLYDSDYLLYDEYAMGFDDGYWVGYDAASDRFGGCGDPDCPTCYPYF